MNVCEMNHQALEALEDRNYQKAQELFYENARTHPCHETYNNLGYYLYTEGIEYARGRYKYRSAQYLGMKYLVKAEALRPSVVNLCNIATVIDLGLRSRDEEIDGFYSYRRGFEALDKALRLAYSDELAYNRLRFLYLWQKNHTEVLTSLEELVKTFPCEQTVEFYLAVLCVHGCFEKCYRKMEEYGAYIDDMDRMIYYCLGGEYLKGAALFDAVRNLNYHFGEDYAAIVTECLVNAGRFEQAEEFAAEVIETEKGYDWRARGQWPPKMFENLKQSTEYRRQVIRDYTFVPEYLTPCGYFGCTRHGNPDITCES